MSECIVRMEKPKSCEACDLAVKYQRFGTEICCPFMGWYANYDKCPIILQLPEKHGRLVDADALYKKRYIVEPGDILASITVVDACYISGAQTIVPATEGGKRK